MSRLVNSSALQSWKWQLIGMSQCLLNMSMASGSLVALSDNDSLTGV